MIKKDAEIKFRVDSQTAKAAKAAAEQLDVSLSQILRELLRKWVAEQPKEQKSESK